MNAPTKFRPLDPESVLNFPGEGINLIEASAGTGKTYTIANLFIRYILDGTGCSEILVVTFTNAATEELKGRIRSRLADLLQFLKCPGESEDTFFTCIIEQNQEASGKERIIDRITLAIRTMDEAAIYTIHGFCQRVLADYAFFSGQPYDNEFIADDEEFWCQALQDWWRINTYELDAGQARLFLSAVGTIEELGRRLLSLRGVQPRRLEPQAPESLEELYAQWDQLGPSLLQIAAIWKERSATIITILSKSRALSQAKASPYGKHRFKDTIGRIDRYLNGPGLVANLEILFLLSITCLDKYSTESKRGSDPALREAFFMQCQEIWVQIDRVVAKARVRILQEASQFSRKHAASAREKRRLMTYDDQLLQVHTALKGRLGKELAQNLRQSFPVAMIDEFQDTDRIQYEIFREIYGQTKRSVLTLIGDPKQSIYRFRGSDLLTYIQARRDAGDQSFSLDTNWRSTPELVRAVNTLFSLRQSPFIYDEAIRFAPVKAAQTRDAGQKNDTGPFHPSMTIWKIPPNPTGKPLSRTAAREAVASATAGTILELLQGGETEACEIAVLVRTNDEGRLIRYALQALGVLAVAIARDNIYQTPEAFGLETLLEAIASPEDRQLARNALASELLGLDYPEIDCRISDESRWQNWINGIHELHERWRQYGFMAMFHGLLQRQAIAERLAAADNAERRLTNLIHIAELLQQASVLHPAPASLVRWLTRQRNDPGSHETEVRLESDDALVRIVTIHSSKGLEFPVVFVPFAWACRPIEDQAENLIAFSDRNGTACLDAGPSSEARSRSLCLAEKERLAEDIRLLYVALTRAERKLYLSWGRVDSRRRDLSGKSALAYLLHSAQTPGTLTESLPNAWTDETDLDADLRTLCQAAEGSIAMVDLPESAANYWQSIPNEHKQPIRLGQFTGRIRDNWKVASFSGMTRNVHQVRNYGSSHSGQDRILQFPAGTRTGSFMHLVLENLDFQGDIGPQAEKLWLRFAPRFGLNAPDHLETLVQWLNNIIQTSLDQNELSLSQIACNRCLHEMEFDFSLEHGAIEELNRVLARNAGKTLEPIEYDDFEGIVTGIIDLVFEHKGRFYLVDYKTNFLGATLNDYRPDKLEDEILDRRYDLQYLLYTVALHRYLGQRLPCYRYETHFGGVYYLFLRAMRPGDTDSRGIFHVCPNPEIIQVLDRTVFAPPPTAVTNA